MYLIYFDARHFRLHFIVLVIIQTISSVLSLTIRFKYRFNELHKYLLLLAKTVIHFSFVWRRFLSLYDHSQPFFMSISHYSNA